MWKATISLVASTLLLLTLKADAQILTGASAKKPSLRVGLSTVKPKAKYVFTMTKPVESARPVFDDNFIVIGFALGQEQFAFELLNKTDKVLKVLWNQVSYIDPVGQSHRVIHAGVNYVDKEKDLPTTIVPPTAKIRDVIFPTTFVRYISPRTWGNTYYAGGWFKDELFPKPDKKEAQQYVGRTLSFFMPLEINGEVKNYLFTFRIDIVRE